MEYNEFLKTYTIDFLSKIDLDVHEKMINRYLSLFGKKDNLVFFDIGSNAGSFIEASINIFDDINIHAFEPHPYLFEYLKNKYDRIKINEYCVIDIDGICNINIPNISVGLSSVINRDVFNNLKEQKVTKLSRDSITLDTYCLKNNIEKIDYLKIDVEGAEYLVFKGSLELIKNGKIISGQFEVGIDESGYSTNDIINLLEKNNYIIEKLSKNDYFFYKK